ncbi:Uncharacterized protein K02A2.6, partial [Exaiptasia diaphana]
SSPKVTINPDETTLTSFRGSSQTLTCTVIAASSSYIQWFRKSTMKIENATSGSVVVKFISAQDIISTYKCTRKDPKSRSVICTMSYTCRVMIDENTEPAEATAQVAVKLMPDIAPQGIEVTEQNKTTFIIAWKTLPRNKANGEITKYKIVWALRHIGRAKRLAVGDTFTGTTKRTQFVLQGLRLCAQYEVHVAAATIAGLGPNATQGVTTSRPGEPHNLKSRRIGKSFITLAWEKPKGMIEDVTDYMTIHPLGEVNVDVEYANTSYALPLLIVNTRTTPLFGRNWLRKVNLHWSELPGIGTIHNVNPTTKYNLTSLLQEHETLFDSGLGCYNGPPEHLKVTETPGFYKARPVDYARRTKVEQALSKMENEGVINKVTSAPSAAPIVVVGKKDTEDVHLDIEKTVKSCHVCQVTRADPAGAPVHPWCYPTGPWQRLHIDFKGPVQGQMFLVVVDAYSKYPEVVKMSSTTSTATVKVLREIFSRHGLPETIVSDNGPQLTSEEFQNFCSANGIIHRRSAPYKPSTNGQAERIVQVLKTALTQASITKEDIDSAVARHMLVYRNTAHTLTGESPSMLLMKRKFRTMLDLLKPSLQRHVQEKQNTIAERTANRQLRKFQEGEAVMVRNYGNGERWLPGTVSEVLGTRNYMVHTQGQVWKRHVDQLLQRQEEANTSVKQEDHFKEVVPDAKDMQMTESPTTPVPVQANISNKDPAMTQRVVPRSPNPVVHRYPTRREDVVYMGSLCLGRKACWGTHEFTNSLGFENKMVSNSQETSSSSSQRTPGFLYGTSAWCSPYIQISFQQVIQVTGVATQGDRARNDTWVTSYTIAYSLDKKNRTSNRVAVIPKVKISPTQVPLQSGKGRSQTLKCTVIDKPSSTFQWFRNGTTMIHDATRSSLSVHFNSAAEIKSKYECKRKNPNLRLVVCKMSYTCKAVLPVDVPSAEATAQVTVNLYVPAKQVFSVTPGKQSLTLNWTPVRSDAVGKITSYVIKIYMNEKEFRIQADKTRHTYNMTGLKPYTRYKIQMKAISIVGEGLWSVIKTVTTLSSRPEGTPSRVSVTPKSSRSIEVTWKLPRWAKFNGPSTGFRITYTDARRIKKTKLVENVRKALLTNLNKWMKYSITVSIWNSKYYGPESIIATATTKEDGK